MAETLIAMGIGKLTAAAIASAASTAATVASVGSAVIGGVGAIQSGRNQAAVMKANARNAEQQGRERQVAANIEAERMRRQSRLVAARGRAGMAEAGALSGTSLDLLDQNSVAMELDALTVQFNGAEAARGARNQGNVTRAEASQVQRAGIISGASQMVGSFAAIDPLNFSPSNPGSFAPVKIQPGALY